MKIETRVFINSLAIIMLGVGSFIGTYVTRDNFQKLELKIEKAENLSMSRDLKIAKSIDEVSRGRNHASVISDSVWKVNQNCSSVLISETRALTASHCIQLAQTGTLSREVTETSQQQMPYKVIKDDKANDLALLEVNAPEAAVLSPMAEEICAAPGDDVYLSGYPAAITLELTRGLYSGKVMLGNRVYLKATPAGFPGNSGGPLYQVCNGKYEVIGIVSQGYREQNVPVTHMLIYNPLDKIKEFLSGT